jgi:hypothetical protein
MGDKSRPGSESNITNGFATESQTRFVTGSRIRFSFGSGIIFVKPDLVHQFNIPN